MFCLLFAIFQRYLRFRHRGSGFTTKFRIRRPMKKVSAREKKSLFLLWAPKTNDRTNWEAAAAAAKKTSLRLDVTVLYSIGSSNCYRNGEKKTAAHTQKILESKMGEKKKSMRNKWYQTNQMRQVKMVAGIKLEYNTKIKCIYLITYCFLDASCSIKNEIQHTVKKFKRHANNVHMHMQYIQILWPYAHSALYKTAAN